MGFKSSKCDPDLWIKDMGTHYEYIATYIDDLLIVSKDPRPIIKELERTYTLKGVGDPIYYLGGDIVNTKDLKEWCMAPIDWILSSQTYAGNMIEKFESLMADGRSQYCFKEYKTPMDKEYHPELDESPLLNAELHS